MEARLADVGPELRKVLSDIAAGVYKRARVKPGRAAHDSGVTARGYLRVLDRLDLPPHSILAPGATYEVVLRHSNARGFPDDAVLDGRGAALRLLRPGGTGAPDDALLDLILVTGRTFVARDAASFARWAAANPEQKAAIVRADPRIAASLAELIRDPDSYRSLHYYSQVTYRFVGLDGAPRLVRYRLLPADRRPDGGFVDPRDLRLPLDYAPRRAGDLRPADYLRAEQRSRVERGQASYLLQSQLADDIGDPYTLDPSQAWDEAGHPWRDLATIMLDRLVPDDEGEALRYNPINAPPELGLIPAERPDDPASVNHARAVAYAISAYARHGLELPMALRALVHQPGATAAYDGPVGSLKDALISAAGAIHYQPLPWMAGAPRERIPAALRGSGLASFPASLERILARFVVETPSAWVPTPERALPESFRDWISSRSELFARAGSGDADAFRAVLESYSPVCMEAFTWNGLLGVQLFANRLEYLAYMNRATRVLPTGSALPAAVRVGADAILAVLRLMSPEATTGLVVLSEYACSMKRDAAGGWMMEAVLETDYREEPVAGADGGEAQMAAYGARELLPDERDFKLCQARAAGLLVEEYAASLGEAVEQSGSGGGPEAPRRESPVAGGSPPGTPESAASRRVCVVGAGPAGLIVARELERRGHRVTVLERADAVGGKASSIEIDDRWYDLGAHVCIGEHLETWRLAHEVGCGIEPVVQTRVFDLDRRVNLVPRSAFADQAAVRAYREARQARFPGVTGPSLRDVGHALDAPVGELLDTAEGKALAAVDLVFAGAGYGFLADPELPALYVARFAELAAGLGEEPTPERLRRWTIEGGFLDLWRRVAAGLRDVRLGVRIEAVERGADGVQVRTRDGVERYDALVVACPFDRALAFLDAGDEERDLFGRLRYLDYYTTIATASGLPRLGFYLVKQHVEGPGTAGHVATFHHRYAEDDVYAFYSYGAPDVSPGDVQRLLHEDVARMGGRVEAIHTQRRWAYFPQVRTRDATDGFFDRMEALQGQRATYYVGGALGFELVEYVIRQAQDVAGRVAGGQWPAAGSCQSSVSSGQRERGAPPRATVHQPPATDHRSPTTRSADEVRAWLVAQIARRTDLAPAAIDPAGPFESLPLESLQIVGLIADLSHWLGWQVTPSIIFQCPTIDAIAEHLAADFADAPRLAAPPPPAAESGSRSGALFGRVRRALTSIGGG